MEPDIKNVEKKVYDLMNELGIFTKCPLEHVKDTPHRIAKMLTNELFSALYNEPPQITTFPSKKSNPVIIKDLELKSMCAHHWMPFYGYATIVYIPDKQIAGLSKFGRVVDYFSRKPQVQEDLTNEIGDYLVDVLKPKALAVHISAIHLCMRHRGLESDNSVTETLYTYGINADYKNEVREIILNTPKKSPV